MKIANWMLTLIVTVMCVYCLYSCQQFFNRRNLGDVEIQKLRVQIADLQVQIKAQAKADQQRTDKVSAELSQLREQTKRDLEKQSWQYQEYRSLDEILTAWFGKQQAAIVKRSAD